MFKILLISTSVYNVKNQENNIFLSNVLLAMVLTLRSKCLRLVIAEKLTLKHRDARYSSAFTSYPSRISDAVTKPPTFGCPDALAGQLFARYVEGYVQALRGWRYRRTRPKRFCLQASYDLQKMTRIFSKQRFHRK